MFSFIFHYSSAVQAKPEFHQPPFYFANIYIESISNNRRKPTSRSKYQTQIWPSAQWTHFLANLGITWVFIYTENKSSESVAFRDSFLVERMKYIFIQLVVCFLEIDPVIWFWFGYSMFSQRTIWLEVNDTITWACDSLVGRRSAFFQYHVMLFRFLRGRRSDTHHVLAARSSWARRVVWSVSRCQFLITRVFFLLCNDMIDDFLWRIWRFNWVDVRTGISKVRLVSRQTILYHCRVRSIDIRPQSSHTAWSYFRTGHITRFRFLRFEFFLTFRRANWSMSEVESLKSLFCRVSFDFTVFFAVWFVSSSCSLK